MTPAYPPSTETAEREPLTTDEIAKILGEARKSRWPIAAALTVENELSASELSRRIGKTLSWTVTQAKAMQAEGILKPNDPDISPKGQPYKLAIEKETLEQFPEYEPALNSLHQPGNLAERLLGAMALQGDEYMQGWGFVPVEVEMAKGGKIKNIKPVGPDMVVVDTEAFLKAFSELIASGGIKISMRDFKGAAPEFGTSARGRQST